MGLKEKDNLSFADWVTHALVSFGRDYKPSLISVSLIFVSGVIT